MEVKKLLIINKLCKALFIILGAVGLISIIVDKTILLCICVAAIFTTQIVFYSTKSELDELED